MMRLEFSVPGSGKRECQVKNEWWKIGVYIIVKENRDCNGLSLKCGLLKSKAGCNFDNSKLAGGCKQNYTFHLLWK